MIYPDAGHGGTFQFHEHFVEKLSSSSRSSAEKAVGVHQSAEQPAPPALATRLPGDARTASSGGLKPPTFDTRPPLRICRGHQGGHRRGQFCALNRPRAARPTTQVLSRREAFREFAVGHAFP